MKVRMRFGVLGDFHGIPATKPNGYSVVAGDIVDIDAANAVRYIESCLATDKLEGDLPRNNYTPGPQEIKALRAKIPTPKPLSRYEQARQGQ